MTLKINIVQHDIYLDIKVSGKYNLTDSLDKFKNVLAACKTTGATKILIDFRSIEGLPQVTEKMLYTLGIQDHYEHYISQGEKPCKMAFVGKPPIITSDDPGLLIDLNEDLPFSLFTDMDKAYKWLEVTPA